MSWADIADSWKYIAVISTALFASIALTADLKDPVLKQLTLAGRFSLFGLLFTGVGGTLAVIGEQRANAEKDAAYKRNQAEVLEQLGRTVSGIERMLTPFSDPSLWATFDINCDRAAYKAFCDEAFATIKPISKQQLIVGTPDFTQPDPPWPTDWPPTRGESHAVIKSASGLWRLWPGGKPPVFRWAIVAVRNPARFAALLTGDREVPDVSLSFQMAYDSDKLSTIAIINGDDRIIRFGVSAPGGSYAPSGRVISVKDFGGASALIYDLDNDIGDYKILDTKLFTRQNRQIAFAPKDFRLSRTFIYPGKKQIAAMSYIFPSIIPVD